MYSLSTHALTSSLPHPFRHKFAASANFWTRARLEPALFWYKWQRTQTEGHENNLICGRLYSQGMVVDVGTTTLRRTMPRNSSIRGTIFCGGMALVASFLMILLERQLQASQRATMSHESWIGDSFQLLNNVMTTTTEHATLTSTLLSSSSPSATIPTTEQKTRMPLSTSTPPTHDTRKPSSIFDSNHNGDWIHQWLVQGTRGHAPRIVFVHVGKTGGSSLDKGVPLDLRGKHVALPCLMETWRNQNLSTSLSVLPLSNSNHSDLSITTNHDHNRSFPSTGFFSFEEAWDHCYRSQRKVSRHPESWLGRLVVSHRHMESPLFSADEKTYVIQQLANSFLVTLRNPLDRLVSAYHYHAHRVRAKQNKTSSRMEEDRSAKPRSPPSLPLRVYQDCFPTIQALADTFLLDAKNTTHVSSHSANKRQENNNQKPNDCAALGRAILQSTNNAYAKSRCVAHWTMNYDYYVRATLDARPDLPVVVIRTDHLWSDAYQLNQALATLHESISSSSTFTTKIGTATYDDGAHPPNNATSRTFARFMHYTHGSEHYFNNTNNNDTMDSSTRTSILSPRQKRALCCVLDRDLQAYQTLVERALNLVQEEKRQLLQRLWDDCGVENDSPYYGNPGTPTSRSKSSTATTSRDGNTSFSWSQWRRQHCPFQEGGEK